jgi:hypothetical protein
MVGHHDERTVGVASGSLATVHSTEKASHWLWSKDNNGFCGETNADEIQFDFSDRCDGLLYRS